MKRSLLTVGEELHLTNLRERRRKLRLKIVLFILIAELGVTLGIAGAKFYHQHCTCRILGRG